MKKILMSRKWTVTRDRGVSFDDVNLRGRGFYKQQTNAPRLQLPTLPCMYECTGVKNEKGEHRKTWMG